MTFLVSLMGFFLMFSEGEGAISFGIYDIAKSLTIPGWVVIIVLLIEAVYMIAVGIERWLTYNKAKQQSRQYAPKVAQAQFLPTQHCAENVTSEAEFFAAEDLSFQPTTTMLKDRHDILELSSAVC